MEKLFKQEDPVPNLSAVSHSNNLNFIRWVLSVLVIYAHSFLITYQGKKWINNLHPGQLDIGGMSVDLFFVISGYLVLQSRAHCHSIFDFSVKRMLRIYPAFIVVTLVGIISLHGSFNFSNLLNIIKLEIINIPNPFKNIEVISWNGSLWTLWYEGFCYLLLALLWEFRVIQNKFICLGLLVITTFLFWYRESIMHIDEFNSIIRFLSAFLAGCSYYNFRHYIKPNRYLFLACLLILYGFSFFTGMRWFLPIFGGYVILYLAFFVRPMAWNWDLSYGAYIWGWLIMCWIVDYFHNTLTSEKAFILTLIVVTPIAMASWLMVERPALSLKNKWSGKL